MKVKKILWGSLCGVNSKKYDIVSLQSEALVLLYLFLEIEFNGMDHMHIFLVISFFLAVGLYAGYNLLLCWSWLRLWILCHIDLWFSDLGHCTVLYFWCFFFFGFWCAFIRSLLISKWVLWWVYLSHACKTFWELSTTSDFHGESHMAWCFICHHCIVIY